MEIFRPDSKTVWNDKDVEHRLSWYRKVMTGESPPKFLLCKMISAENPEGLKEEELWAIHERLQNDFQKIFEDVIDGKEKLSSLKIVKPNYLDVKGSLAEKMTEKCTFCEKACGVNRKKGEKGSCRVGFRTKVSTWFNHFGEEAPLIGEGGSGTIFFSGCNFGPCVYCQNWDISVDPENGVDVSHETLALVSRKLAMDGAANVNYVGGEPTPNLHTILLSLRYLDVNIAQLWNSNMYCSISTMKLLSDVIDIWLPDFKYGNDACAEKLSKVNRYFEVVSRNHKIAHDSGSILIRHLVLPGHVDCCTKPILDWISRNLPNALVNIMGQYHPDYLVSDNPNKYKSISLKVSDEEMDQAYAYAENLNLVYKPVSG
ncbi:MAG: radical SAM protein [Nitrososphaeria archaeon]|jgi:putative pyruvate formate lyase activating enzyme